MFHPLLTRLATQPDLVVEHAGAYAQLAGAEADQLGRRWLRRGALVALAVACTVLALGLAGVALLLAAAFPVAQMPMPWVLWLVPALMAAVALLLALLARGGDDERAFPRLREQLQADAQLLRAVEAS